MRRHEASPALSTFHRAAPVELKSQSLGSRKRARKEFLSRRKLCVPALATEGRAFYAAYHRIRVLLGSPPSAAARGQVLLLPKLRIVLGAAYSPAPSRDQFVMWAVLTACWNIASSAALMSAGVFAV